RQFTGPGDWKSSKSLSKMLSSMAPAFSDRAGSVDPAGGRRYRRRLGPPPAGPRCRVVCPREDCMTSPPQAGRDLVAVTAEPIDVAAVVAHVTDPGAGAVVLFLGTARDHSEDASGITHLEYEAYEGVVDDVIAAVVAEARERWPVERVAAVHRTG